MGLKRYFNVRLLAALGLGAGLIAAVACGGASDEPAAPAATAAPASSDAAAPTAMPEATEVMMAEETGGHVNLLVTNIGNGKFDPLLTEGEDLKFQRMFQVALVGGAGGSELVPAVAKDWSISDDGKIWTFSVNDGFITAHDGIVITRDDVYFNLNSRVGAEAFELLDTGYYEPRDVALANLIEGVSKGPADDQVQVAFKTVRLAACTTTYLARVTTCRWSILLIVHQNVHRTTSHNTVVLLRSFPEDDIREHCRLVQATRERAGNPYSPQIAIFLTSNIVALMDSRNDFHTQKRRTKVQFV